jgi:hypothetical protein
LPAPITSTSIGQPTLVSAASSDNFVPFLDFIHAIGERAIVIALPNGDVDRIRFETNHFRVVKGIFERGVAPDQSGNPTRFESYEQDPRSRLVVSPSADGRFLQLTGPTTSQAGDYKYPFLILVPMTREFLDAADAGSGVRVNLRESNATDWDVMPSADGYLEQP